MRTIVWDIDDVLNDLMRGWFEDRWLRSHPKCVLQYGEITENPPHRILGCRKDEYLISLDEFRLSGAYKALKPVEDVFLWFHEFGHSFRHIALTAAPLSSASISAEWVIRNFGRWIRSFSFVPSQRDGEDIPLYDKTKNEALTRLGKADILVDDSIDNVEAAKATGMRAILMPRPWNKNKMTAKQTLDPLISFAPGD